MQGDVGGPATSVLLRPFHLPHRADFGLRGTSDSVCCSVCKLELIKNAILPLETTEEVQHQLMQLVALNGFQTNPDVPGCERMVGTWLQREWLSAGREVVPASEIANCCANLLDAEQLFMVKGWNRSVCALGVMYMCYCNEELLQAGFNMLCPSLCLVQNTVRRCRHM